MLQNLTNSCVEDEDDDPDTLSRVKNLLSNSELNDKETDDESSKITNNVSRFELIKKKLNYKSRVFFGGILDT